MASAAKSHQGDGIRLIKTWEIERRHFNLSMVLRSLGFMARSDYPNPSTSDIYEFLVETGQNKVIDEMLPQATRNHKTHKCSLDTLNMVAK